MLLRKVEAEFGFRERIARGFVDSRDFELVESSVLDFVKQRVFGISLGYKDLDDIRNETCFAGRWIAVR